jgi:hypothetical protein
MVSNHFYIQHYDVKYITIPIENLTKEQFSGEYRTKLPMLNASRDSLNPALNLETLKNRLFVMEHYRTLHGVEFAYWPHYALRNLGRHVNKYKFNYALKAFVLYSAIRDIQIYRHASRTRFLRLDEMFSLSAQIGASSLVAGAVFYLL